MRFAILILFALCLWTSLALPRDHLNATVEAPVDAGTFQNPSNNVRPKFRYWIPDASIDTENLSKDIVALAERGAGGIQFLNYFFYGGQEGSPPPEIDWNIYGYGTPAYVNVLKAALQTTKDHGLVMDFCMGPQSGQGVPAEPDEVGLTWELVSYNMTLNGSYNGQLPGWGEGDFVSAVTFDLSNVTTVPDAFYLPIGDTNKTQYRFDWSSLVEVTDLASPNGSISIDDSVLNGTQPNTLFASYARRSYTRACIASSDEPQNILHNGSFAVDHFSAAGAQLTTSFLDNYILVNGTKELFVEVGNYIWEDSVEIHVPNFWTPGLLDIFQQRNNYSMTKYIPLLWGYSGDLAAGLPVQNLVSDSPENDYNFLADLRSTMVELYAHYVEYLVNWTHTTLDLQFSAQIGYNLPVDMLENVPLVDAPETETLSFSNNIDAFRQYTGAADLAGKRIISIELGADLFASYSQSLSTLLFEAKRSFVAGVNQLVIHGATYSYFYPNTTWPGFTSFSYLFSAQHSRHQPAWDVGYPEAINWMARTLWVLQTGVPKVDLAFWDKQLEQNPYPNTSYVPIDLADAGYTYQYLTAENLNLPAAQVSHGLLAPTRQGFKALILRGNDTLTVQGVNRVVELAQAGLPLFFSGGVPTRYATSNAEAISAANAQLQSVLNLTNVHQIPAGPINDEIQSTGIQPRTMISSNTTWYTRWREDQNGDVYVFVYNDRNSSSSGNVSFATTSRPFRLDAWTGEEEPVVAYSTSNGYTTVALSLAATQATIFRFSNQTSTQTPDVHITSAPPDILGFSFSNTSNAIYAKIPHTTTALTISLSNGSTTTIPPTSSLPTPYPLSNWSLTVERWHSPIDPYNLNPDANKTNTTAIPLSSPDLPPWSTIPSLSNTSGIGHYTLTFTWPPPSSSSSSNTTTTTLTSNLGALLTIPPVPQGLQATLNTHPLPTLDLTNPQVDITPYLVTGANQLNLKVATTLFNALRPGWDGLVTAGHGPSISLEGLEAMGVGREVEEGVVGRVVVVPYAGVRVV